MIQLPTDIDDDQITPTGFLSAPRTSPEDPPTIMTGAIHVAKLRQICSQFSDRIYSSEKLFNNDRRKEIAARDSLRNKLDQWRDAIPEARPDPDAANPLSVFTSSAWFQLAYNSSILMLYRYDITKVDKGHERIGGYDFDDRTAVELAFEESARNARELCMTYRRLYQSPSIQFTWGSLHILFLGGLTFIYCLWQSRRIREMFTNPDIISTCGACNMVLVIIAERWREAAPYRDIFETLSERTINMVYSARTSDLSSGRMPTQSSLNDTEISTNEPTWQDWVMGMDDIAIPQDSEWLFQELFGNS